MTKPFWILHITFNGFTIASADWDRSEFVTISDRDANPYLAPEQETSSWAIGRFFLSYAYSTPAGVAYRLTYGIPKEQP